MAKFTLIITLSIFAICNADEIKNPIENAELLQKFIQKHPDSLLMSRAEVPFCQSNVSALMNGKYEEIKPLQKFETLDDMNAYIMNTYSCPSFSFNKFHIYMGPELDITANVIPPIFLYEIKKGDDLSFALFPSGMDSDKSYREDTSKYTGGTYPSYYFFNAKTCEATGNTLTFFIPEKEKRITLSHAGLLHMADDRFLIYKFYLFDFDARYEFRAIFEPASPTNWCKAWAPKDGKIYFKDENDI